MVSFWAAVGLVLVVVLVGAWLYDRRSGSRDLTDRDRGTYEATHHQAKSDADVTRFNNNGGYGGGF